MLTILIDAATKIPEETKTTNPREFANIMEFVECKGTVEMTDV